MTSRFGRLLSVVGYRIVLWTIALLPASLAFPLARAFGRLRYRWRWRVRQVERTAIVSRLGASFEQADAWQRRAFELGVSESLEGCLAYSLPARRFADLVEIRGLDHLKAALERGHGAILYSGHGWGCYTFLAALGQLGLRPNFVRLGLESVLPPLQRWFYRRRFTVLERKFGCRSLCMRPDRPPPATTRPGTTTGETVAARASIAVKSGPSVRDQVTQALERNEIVVILIDLSFARNNVAARFFGETMPFPPGPAELARSTGAPLLDFFVYRTDAWVPQVAEIGPPFDASDDLAATVQRCATRLEEWIRRHPADWAPWHILANRPSG
ncbi:MAG: lysophospholipid acyltransferase family protein [Candidatus Dormibacteraceae bacterium]